VKKGYVLKVTKKKIIQVRQISLKEKPWKIWEDRNQPVKKFGIGGGIPGLVTMKNGTRFKSELRERVIETLREHFESEKRGHGVAGRSNSERTQLSKSTVPRNLTCGVAKKSSSRKSLRKNISIKGNQRNRRPGTISQRCGG